VRTYYRLLGLTQEEIDAENPTWVDVLGLVAFAVLLVALYCLLGSGE